MKRMRSLILATKNGGKDLTVLFPSCLLDFLAAFYYENFHTEKLEELTVKTCILTT